MKYILAIISCMAWAQCQAGPAVSPKGACAEQQQVADAWLATIKDIGASPEQPTERNVASLVKPLLKNFNFDQGQCQGYTEQVKDASRAVIKKRVAEISQTLHQLCSTRPDPDVRDTALLSAMHEESMAAKEALAILNESTSECLAN